MMDRLFGKELSNLLEPFVAHKNRLSFKVPSKSTRAPHDDKIKLTCRRQDRCASLENQDPKLQHPTDEAEQLMPQEPSQKEPDVQLVPDYFDECLQFMLEQEARKYDLTDVMAKQTEVNEKMRGILLQWLVELHHKFKMFPQTLFAVTMLIDRYLSRKPVKKDSLQLLGTAAFYIAAKYQETYRVPELGDLVHFAAKAFTKQDLIKAEADIIEVVQFDLVMDTSFKFFQALARISNMDTKNFHLAQYVLQLSLLDTKYLAYKPSVLASSVIYLINKIRKRNEAWPDLLLAATGYQEKDLKNCARDLCYLLEKADSLPNTKSLKKKFSSSEYNEVTRIKLERRKN